jgi:hypothetical protein
MRILLAVFIEFAPELTRGTQRLSSCSDTLLE